MRWRRFVLLATSVFVVTVLAGAAGWAQISAAETARMVHVADRVQQQKVLASLATQYLQSTFLAVGTAAQATDWKLTPGSRADEGHLKAYAESSPLTGYGAALVDFSGRLLTSYPSVSALPPASDPGYGPLRLSMIAGKPGLSSVMTVAGRPLAAFAVPVLRSGKPVAIFAAFADLRTWALQRYMERLEIGPQAKPYTVDSQGVVTAAADPTLVGTTMSAGTAVRAALDGRTGTATYSPATSAGGRGPTTFVSYAPVTVGGWAALAEQPRAVFYGSLSSRSDRVLLALVVLLGIVVILLVVLNHRRHSLAQELADQRLHDPLTGLGQRALFDLKLQEALGRHRRTGRPVAVIYADLDAFKQVNDWLGHQAGDQLLVTVANRLRAAARADDAVVRLGGDEFAIIAEGVHVEALGSLVQRIRVGVGAEVVVAGERLMPSISVGGAVLEPGAPAEELVHAADLAMYRAKTTGSGVHVTVVSRPATFDLPTQAGGVERIEQVEQVVRTGS